MQPPETQIPLSTIHDTSPEFATRLDLHPSDLAADLEANGQINAIHLWSTTGEPPYLILAGHRRTAAAKLLQWPTIRAIVHQGLPRNDAWRLAWQDNAARRSLTASDRQWTVARLLAEGHNQATVAAMLGVSKSVVSRDAGWLQLPQVVRDQVGEQGFSHGHAVALIDQLGTLSAAAMHKLVEAYRKDPCEREEFRKRTLQAARTGRVRWPKAAKVSGDRLTLDLAALRADDLSDSQREQLVALLQRALAAVVVPPVAVAGEE